MRSEKDKVIRRRAARASLIGSILEWYDFTIYSSAAAVVFPELFFPNQSPAIGALAALATFGVAYFMRPVGGVVLAGLGDRFGRKSVLVATLILMGTATTLMGALPTYEDIGYWATVLLVFLRLIQGIGAGAELGGATLIAAEFAPPGRRGVYTAWASAGIWMGIGLAAATMSIVALLLGDSFGAWGWRLPFLLSAVVAIYGLVLRWRLDDTPVFEALKARGERSAQPIREVIRHHKGTLAAIALIQFGIGGITVVYTAYSLSYAVGTLGLSGSGATAGLVFAMMFGSLTTPMFGALSDRIGRRPVYLMGMVFIAVFSAPFFWISGATNGPWGFWLALTAVMAVGVAGAFGSQGVLYVEMLPVAQRYSGFALARETSNGLAGGLTPVVAASIVIAAGGAWWPVALLVTGLSTVTIVGLLLIRETLGAPSPDPVTVESHVPGEKVR